MVSTNEGGAMQNIDAIIRDVITKCEASGGCEWGYIQKIISPLYKQGSDSQREYINLKLEKLKSRVILPSNYKVILMQ